MLGWATWLGFEGKAGKRIVKSPFSETWAAFWWFWVPSIYYRYNIDRLYKVFLSEECRKFGTTQQLNSQIKHCNIHAGGGWTASRVWEAICWVWGPWQPGGSLVGLKFWMTPHYIASWISWEWPRSRGALSELRRSRRGHCNFRHVVGTPIIQHINVNTMQSLDTHTHNYNYRASGTGSANGMHANSKLPFTC